MDNLKKRKMCTKCDTIIIRKFKASFKPWISLVEGSEQLYRTKWLCLWNAKIFDIEYGMPKTFRFCLSIGPIRLFLSYYFSSMSKLKTVSL